MFYYNLYIIFFRILFFLKYIFNENIRCFFWLLNFLKICEGFLYNGIFERMYVNVEKLLIRVN